MRVAGLDRPVTLDARPPPRVATRVAEEGAVVAVLSALVALPARRARRVAPPFTPAGRPAGDAGPDSSVTASADGALTPGGPAGGLAGGALAASRVTARISTESLGEVVVVVERGERGLVVRLGVDGLCEADAREVEESLVRTLGDEGLTLASCAVCPAADVLGTGLAQSPTEAPPGDAGAASARPARRLVNLVG